ncbi:MAG: GNAT family N-acetyltransferase [Proteobacteria bacterium]|nr:GNAT family N-acetyltransferase [Pseudomonadota bacterium]MCP4916629.1 GNAT family N-acetyltransferase [Pseudomonadota bacterium]
MEIGRFDKDVTLIRVDNPREVLPYRASFVGAYQTIWSEPPYREEFYPYEAEGVLRRQLQSDRHITLIAVRGLSSVVGFGFAVPVRSRPEVARHMQGLLPVEHTFYLSELGVLDDYRGLGLGRAMIGARLEAIDKKVYTHALLRTSASRQSGYDMYLDMGFDDIGVYMEVPSRRIGGGVSTDRRLFLSKVLGS